MSEIAPLLPDPSQSDLQATRLFREAYSLAETVYRPGTGYPIGATELTVSADGEQLAFTGPVPESLLSTPPTRICLVNLRTKALRVASFGPNFDLTPRFSPDGHLLAFRSDREAPGHFQVYLLDLRDGLTHPVPKLSGWVESLEFSPDGRSLLVLVAGHGADLSGAQGARSSPRKGPFKGWMPTVDTGEESFRRRAAWVVDLARHRVRRASPPGVNVWEACWCGNNAIAAITSKGASENDWYGAQLIRVDLQRGRIAALYAPKDQLGWLSGAPDGRRLAVVEAVCSDRGLCAGNLLIVDAQKGRVRSLQCAGIDVTSTAWRDSRRVLVSGLRNLETAVVDVDAVAGKTKELWSSQVLCSHSPFYPHAAGAGAQGFVMAVQGHREPASILHVSRGRARSVISFAGVECSELARRLPEVEPYRWSAPDGQQIQGWLMRGSGKTPPLVMEVHGGPIWRSSPFFLGRNPHYAMLAMRGYSLFWPNPRGSSGRGQDFARAVMGDMGGKDMVDLLSGVDSLLERGGFDSRRLGVIGGSYGGFMTAWLVTQDPRFAAGVAVAPMTDWLSQHLTCNIGHFIETYLLDSETNLRRRDYLTRSPVMFADRVNTPMLNVCGALDHCTPPSQAQEFHNALREHAVESMLVTYPREGHGVRSFPAMIDYSARVVDWFERHIGARRKGS